VPLPMLPWGATAEPQVRVHAHAIATPALFARTVPELVLDSEEIAQLRVGAAEQDARRGGQFLLTPASVQWWDHPWRSDDPNGSTVLGAIDLVVDRPMRGQCSVPRVLVTPAGVHAGLTPADVARVVLALGHLDVDEKCLTPPMAPPPDPFRSRHPHLTQW